MADQAKEKSLYEEELAAKLKAKEEGALVPEGTESAMVDTAKTWAEIKPVVY
jgi:hypothetical protein